MVVIDSWAGRVFVFKGKWWAVPQLDRQRQATQEFRSTEVIVVRAPPSATNAIPTVPAQKGIGPPLAMAKVSITCFDPVD